MEVKRLRNLALEVFKKLNNMNPECMREIFHKTHITTHVTLNLDVNENHATEYGSESLKSLGPQI